MTIPTNELTRFLNEETLFAGEVCRRLNITLPGLNRMTRAGVLLPVRGSGRNGLYLRSDVEKVRESLGAGRPLRARWIYRLSAVPVMVLLALALAVPATAAVQGSWSAGQAQRWAAMDDGTTVYTAPAGWRIMGIRVESPTFADPLVYEFDAGGQLLRSTYAQPLTSNAPGWTLLTFNKPYSVALYVKLGWAYVDAVWLAPIIDDKVGTVDLSQAQVVTFTNPMLQADANAGAEQGPTSAPPAPEPPQDPGNQCP